MLQRAFGRAVLIACVALVPAGAAWGHVGTWGTDTYCDCVKDRASTGQNVDANGAASSCTGSLDGNLNPAACYASNACRLAAGHAHVNGTGIPIDPNLRMCEDFEAPTLTNDGAGRASFLGAGAPGFGPAYDTRGATSGWRGFNGYWMRTYGTTGSAALWPNGTPASPTYGAPCTAGGAGCAVTLWNPGDPWNVGNRTSLAVFKDSDTWNPDEPSLMNAGGPRCPDGSRGACDDSQTGGYRLPPGGSGYLGAGPKFSSPITHLGYTMLIGYSETVDDAPATCNGGTACIFRAWKHDEFMLANGSVGNFFMGSANGCADDEQPMSPYLAPFDGSCSTNPPTAVVGSAGCNTKDIYRFCPAPASYSRMTDFAPGTVHCVQTELKGMGTSNAELRQWLDGKLLIHATGMKLTGAWANYTAYFWGAYSNMNANPPDSVHTVETIYRYQDNIHVRQGPAPACPTSFAGEPVPPPPGTGTLPPVAPNLSQ